NVFPFHAGSPSRPQGFKCRFFGGEACGVMDYRKRGFLAVLDLTFCIYSIEKAVTEPFDGLAKPVILDDVDTEAEDHEFMLQVKRQDQITFIHSEVLDRVSGVVHAFSTRRGERNDFSLGPADSPNPMIQINRARFLAAIGAPGWPIIKLKQIHSGTVIDVDDTSGASEAVPGDAAVTS